MKNKRYENLKEKYNHVKQSRVDTKSHIEKSHESNKFELGHIHTHRNKLEREIEDLKVTIHDLQTQIQQNDGIHNASINQ